MQTFFKDLKVIELANVLAGPAVGMFFAELGADVTKIENKLSNGDITRSWKLSSENKNNPSSAYYASANWNKKIIFSDLTNAAEREKIYTLIQSADILISNYKSGDDKKLGMDYETIKKINPQIIYAQITGFGMDSKRTAFDLVLQAESGFMSMNGTIESGPLKMPVALIDVLTAHQLKEAILIALIKKMKTNLGSLVTVSLFDTAITSLANQASNWLMAGHETKTAGSLHPNIAPYGELFETKDKRQIVLAIGTDKQFIHFCEIIKVKELSINQKFSSNTNRVLNRIELFSILQPIIENMESHFLMKKFMDQDVPVGLIKSVKEVFSGPETIQFILTDKTPDEYENKRVKTISFSIS